MNKKEQIDLILRRTVEVHNKETLIEKLNSGRKLVVKFGADPSRPDLHLGHTVPLKVLKILQELGHEIVFVIGDFTAMIGDPSGKSKTRPSLSFEETRKNGETYFKQVAKILDPSKIRIAYNSEWLGKMLFEDVIKLTGKYTVARILERDDFNSRFKNNIPIGIHEFLYPLMQGYDSVALHADIEIGGTDQTFNLLVGRELQRDYGQEPQDVMCFPLLVGLDGKEKMSKSLGNCIYLSDTEEDVHAKIMEMYTDPLHIKVSDPGHIEGNTVFTYLDAFSRPEHFEEYMPDYANLDELKEHYRKGGLGDVKIKRFLNNVMQEELSPIRARRAEFEKDIPEVYNILKKGSDVARETAAQTLSEVKRAMKIDYFEDQDLIRTQSERYAQK